MPEYLFENPDTGEVVSVIQGIDEEHVYSEDGKQFDRVFTVPNASVDSTLDPFSAQQFTDCLLYTSPSPRDQRGSRMPSSA